MKYNHNKIYNVYQIKEIKKKRLDALQKVGLQPQAFHTEGKK